MPINLALIQVITSFFESAFCAKFISLYVWATSEVHGRSHMQPRGIIAGEAFVLQAIYFFILVIVNIFAIHF